MSGFLHTLANWTKRTQFTPDDVFRRQRRIESSSDSELTRHADDVRDRLLNGEKELELTSVTFALVREAAGRQLGIDLRANQLVAASLLLRRNIVELPTGEGKTLAAIPALALRALHGRGVWLATANDYLAGRDARAMQSVFASIGLSVGFVQSHHSHDERRSAYARDITYGTIREFGFDFLRDRLAIGRNGSTSPKIVPLQREPFSVVVDEADSVLLDDARTPLIISEPRDDSHRDIVIHWSVMTGRCLQQDQHYLEDPTSAKVWLTEQGRALIRREATSAILTRVTLPEAYESVVCAIESERSFLINRDYVIRDGKLVIVDKMTGRLAEGRQWQNGIQQSLEAANRLPITPETAPVAKVAVQAFLQHFKHLSGLTGTAQEATGELRRLYDVRTVVVPPFRPCRRIERPVQIIRTLQEKWSAVISAVRELQKQNRPVLIGTRDLNSSEELSDRLRQTQIEHQVLTAKQEADEAELIARAGQAGMVTVSTSIAGRGTDILLGPQVADSGGLHVIAADLFDSGRIDRQLAGRCGRQGDPASYQQILSLEDGLFQVAQPHFNQIRNVPHLHPNNVSRKLALFHAAQRSIERQHTSARRELLSREREQMIRNRELGIDPYLDNAEG